MTDTTLFTSESVSEGHPDKMADQISDAVLDAILAKDPHARVACETLVTTGLCLVSGEVTTGEYIEIPDIARQVIREIGYDNAEFGFDGKTCGVLVALDAQSPDIAQGVDRSEEVRARTGSDDLDLQGASYAVEKCKLVTLSPLLTKPRRRCVSIDHYCNPPLKISASVSVLLISSYD